MSILLVPLDDRPCCTQFVQRLAAMAGRELVLPDRLGNFLNPGDPEAMLAAMDEPHEALLVSLDMVAWGGLVASRAQKEPLETARERLERAALLASGRPACAFQSIMRTAPTQTSRQEVELAEKLVELSVLTARRDPRASALRATLPADYLEDYLTRRKRAHQLNRLAIDQAGQGSWRELLLGIDDSRTEGWNVLEILELEPLLPSNASIAPGTDEMALLLFTRLVRLTRPIQVLWFPDESAGRVGRYEDRSLLRVVQAQARAAGLTLGASRRQLWVYGPLGDQGEACEQPADRSERADAFVNKLREGLESGLEIAVADVAHANGGDLRLLQSLVASGLAPQLIGYAAWNTAGNTLGTALSVLGCWPEQAEPAQQRVRLRFLMERLLDDGYYQAEIRQHGGTTGLKDVPQSQLDSIQRELSQRLDRLTSAGFPSERLQVELPWGRLFEVRLQVA